VTIKLQEIAKNVGFTTELTKSEKRPEWIVDTFNGIKMELEHHGPHWEFISCFYQPELADMLKANFPQFDKRRGARAKFATPEKLEAFALEILNFIEENEVEGDWAPGRKAIKTPDEGYWEKVAVRFIRDVKEEWEHGLTRTALGFDGHDNLIKIGHSKAYQAAVAADSTYTGRREHIVPCTMIIQEGIRMVREDDASVVKIAQMFKSNLAIVMISDEEQQLVDSVYKTTMPAGWQFGDNICARLDAFNIAY